MTLEYDDIEDLRKALSTLDFGKVELQIHEGSIISMTVTTIKKKPLAKKAKVFVHSQGKATAGSDA